MPVRKVTGPHDNVNYHNNKIVKIIRLINQQSITIKKSTLNN